MIDEQLALIKYEIEYNPHHGGCPPSVKGIKRHGVNEALTAIYEIGLEKIGKDEPAFLYGSKEQLAMGEDDKFENDLAMARNALKASQRKDWAKACGVVEK